MSNPNDDGDLTPSSDDDSTEEQLQRMDAKLRERERLQQEASDSDSSSSDDDDDGSVEVNQSKKKELVMPRNGLSASSSSSSSSLSSSSSSSSDDDDSISTTSGTTTPRQHQPHKYTDPSKEGMPRAHVTSAAFQQLQQRQLSVVKIETGVAPTDSKPIARCTATERSISPQNRTLYDRTTRESIPSPSEATESNHTMSPSNTDEAVAMTARPSPKQAFGTQTAAAAGTVATGRALTLPPTVLQNATNIAVLSSKTIHDGPPKTRAPLTANPYKRTSPSSTTTSTATTSKASPFASPPSALVAVNPYKRVTMSSKNTRAATANMASPSDSSKSSLDASSTSSVADARQRTSTEDVLLTPRPPSPPTPASNLITNTVSAAVAVVKKTIAVNSKTRNFAEATEKPALAAQAPSEKPKESTNLASTPNVYFGNDDDDGDVFFANDSPFFGVNSSNADGGGSSSNSKPKQTHEAAKNATASPFFRQNTRANANSSDEDDSKLAKSSNEKTRRIDQESTRTIDVDLDSSNAAYFSPNGDAASTGEIDPSLYAPPPYQPRPAPFVHSFNLANRPMKVRNRLAISQFFPQPINRFWQSSKFQHFNHLQSEVANVLVHSNDNFLISSPTGSGKSTIFEMAMARLLHQDLQNQPAAAQQQQQSRHIRLVSKHRKMVYVAPSKALCEERYNDWSRRLADLQLGIEVAMITGDQIEPGESFRDLASAHLIVTTPEKFDSLSRRWTENFYLFATIKLFMVDEVHLLGDKCRGWCLETIICRMKTIQRAASKAQIVQSDLFSSSYSNTTPQAIASSLRIVAVSATLPNIQDCADLISASECYTFDQSYRPVPLKTHVVGMGYVGKNAFQFGRSLDRGVASIIQRFSNGKPTIIFCHSKAETETLAGLLTQAHGVGFSQSNFRDSLASQTRVTNLQRVLLKGIAYHHAGLDSQERRLIEKGFIDGKIRVLCATTTLAMGVNLPVHLVIIKGTSAWRGKDAGYQTLDPGSLLQMIGRAGRPGFDTSGTAVLMTDTKSKPRIEKLIHGLGPVESQLNHKLFEVFNSEISQQVISSPESALNWIKETLFFVGVRKNPQRYGIDGRCARSIDAYLMRQCELITDKLKALKFVSSNENDEIYPEAACHIISKNLVDLQASELMVGLPFDASTFQVLSALCHIEDLHSAPRRSEKKFLNEAHKMIRFKLEGPPSKVRVQTPFEKAFVLLQGAIGQHDFEDFTLRKEMSSMIDYSSRMLTALEEYSTAGSRNGHVAIQSLKLRRSLASSLWGENDGVLNQLQGVGQKTTGRLRMNGITTFEHVQKASTETLENASMRPSPFGSQLKGAVDKIMRSALKLSASIQYQNDNPHTPDSILCKLASQSSNTSGAETAGITYTLVAYTDKAGSCFFSRESISSPEDIRIPCPRRFGLVVIQLIASMVGLDERVELRGNDTIGKASYTVQQTTTSSPFGESSRPNAKKQTKIRNATTKTPAASAKSQPRAPLFPKQVEGSSSRKVTSSSTKRARETEIDSGAERSDKVPRQNTFDKTVMSPRQSQRQTNRMPESSRPILQTTNPARTSQQTPASQNSDQSITKAFFENNSSDMLPPHGKSSETANSWYMQKRHQEPSNARRISQSPVPNSQLYDMQVQDQRQLSRQDFWETHGGSQLDHQGQPFRQEQAGPPRVFDNAGAGPVREQSRFSQQSTQARLGSTQLSSVYTPPSYSQMSNPRRARTDTTHTPPPARSAPTPRTSNSKKSAIMPAKSSSWRHEQRQQEKSQARAFTAKKANPFANYKHDPNDAEGFLESLSSANKESSIIPQRELEALRQRNTHQRPLGLVPKKFGRKQQGRGRNKNHSFPTQKMSERELMHMKDAEAKATSCALTARNISPIPQPNFGSTFQRLSVLTPGSSSIVTDYGRQGPVGPVHHPHDMMEMRTQPPFPQQYHYAHHPPPPSQGEFYHHDSVQHFQDAPGDGYYEDNAWDQRQQQYEEGDFAETPWDQSHNHSMQDPQMMTEYAPYNNADEFDQQGANMSPYFGQQGSPDSQQNKFHGAPVPSQMFDHANNGHFQQHPAPLWQQYAAAASTNSGGDPYFDDSAFF